MVRSHHFAHQIVTPVLETGVFLHQSRPAMSVRTCFAPSPTGIAAHRRRAHGALLLALCASPSAASSSCASRTPIASGRPTRGRAGDSRRHAVARARARRGALLPDRSVWIVMREVIAQFLRDGKAYHCYLQQGRARCNARGADCAQGEAALRRSLPHANRRQCRGVAPVVRFRNPDAGSVVVDDVVHGPIALRQRASSTT